MLQLIAVIGTIFFAFSALDKRLAIIETRVNTSIEQQKTFASQTALADLERRISILEQRSQH
jgi:nicotinamide mononucleotide (NMN) deamidase PncC